MQQNTEHQENETMELDLGRMIQISLQVVKKLWLPMLLVVAFFAFALVFIQQKNYTPSYKAYCTFSVHVVNKATLSDTNSIYAVYYDQDLAEQLDATFSYLVNSDFLSDDIKEYLGEKNIPGSIQANSIEGSNIFVLSAISNTPEKAGALLEALMAVYYDAARYVVGDMKTEIIEGPVVPKTPYNTPNKTKAISLGVFIGVAFCLCMIALYAFFKRTVLKPTDLEKHLNMQCFGVVPLLQTKRSLSDTPSSVSITHEQGAFRESIRGIARKLENTIENHNTKVILVTSTATGEGKSMLSQNLAKCFAYWGKKVVLIDGDLRNPTLYRRFGLKQNGMSLNSVLSGTASLDTVLFKDQDENLTLVLNSTPVKTPTALIDSEAMKNLISSFADQSDLVIIDTPPCSRLSDVSLYQHYADGILYVVQQDRMPIRNIVEAAENLGESENKLLGYVLNGAQQISQGYGKYGYGSYSYGKYGKYGKYGYYNNYGETKKNDENLDDNRKQDL